MKFPLFWGQDSDLHLLHRSCFPSPQTHVSLRPLIREEQTWALTARSSGTSAGSANRTPTPADTLQLRRALLSAVLGNHPCLSSPPWREARSGEGQGTCLGRCPARKWWGLVWGHGRGQRDRQAQRAASSAGKNRRRPRCQGLCRHLTAGTGARSQPRASGSASASPPVPAGAGCPPSSPLPGAFHCTLTSTYPHPLPQARRGDTSPTCLKAVLKLDEAEGEIHAPKRQHGKSEDLLSTTSTCEHAYARSKASRELPLHVSHTPRRDGHWR